MNQPATELHLTIMDLPSVVLHLYARAQQPLQENNEPVGLFVRYLRRKAERGLVVIYAVDTLNASHKKHDHDSTTQRTISLALDEQALDEARIRFTQAAIEDAPLTIQPTGVLEADMLGLSVQAFPADSHLTTLAASCDTSASGPLFAVLQEIARTQLKNHQWQLDTVQAEPVRYKPGNRCVIRYQLKLKVDFPKSQAKLPLTIFGKVYANPAQAQSVQALQQQLYMEQLQQNNTPLLPQPLGSVAAIGLTFNEAIQPMEPDAIDKEDYWFSLRTGTRALQPALIRGKGGQVLQPLIPEEELRLTAQALARLHGSKVAISGAPRTGAKEAKRALERAALIAQRYMAQASEVQQLAQQLADRLSSQQPSEYWPAHGGFKASQLLFHSHRVFVVDFDGFCLADPALDVGYFLAYLRPSGLWYHKQGMREWFEAAAATFRQAYGEAMAFHRARPAAIDDILARARNYEAALLFKIATRRVNRLNSPRPQELTVMLNEIAACLADTAGRE